LGVRGLRPHCTAGREAVLAFVLPVPLRALPVPLRALPVPPPFAPLEPLLLLALDCFCLCAAARTEGRPQRRACMHAAHAGACMAWPAERRGPLEASWELLGEAALLHAPAELLHALVLVHPTAAACNRRRLPSPGAGAGEQFCC
jgi:hypothetical protein